MSIQEDLSLVDAQERALRFVRWDEQTAWALGSKLRAWAVERTLPVAIDVRRCGQPLFYAALAETSPDHHAQILRMSNLVAHYHYSSYGMSLRLRLKGETLVQQGRSLAEFSDYGGAFPVVVESAGIVGSVAVAGLAPRANHAFVVEALCELLGKDSAALQLPPE